MIDHYQIVFIHKVEDNDGLLIRAERPSTTYLRVDQKCEFTPLMAFKHLSKRLQEGIEGLEEDDDD